MKFTYSEKASQLLEQFYLPLFIYEKSEWEWDFNQKEQDILKDVFPVLEDLRELFSPYKEKMEQYYLMGKGFSFLQICFLDMQKKGLKVETAEDVHNYCLSLDQAAIQQYLLDFILQEPSDLPETAEFMEVLEQSSLAVNSKWHIASFYRHALASMEQLVALSRELIPLYQPFLDKGAAERREFAAHFSLKDFLESNPHLEMEEDGDNQVYIFSPWLIRFMYQADKSQSMARQSFFLSSRIDQLLQSSQDLNAETFSNILKILSDNTRYNVLVELTKPHAKSKDIAKALAITGAAVSFHTQKLINAQLLLVNQKDKHVKYDMNKKLLQDVLRKLEMDFDLETLD